MVARRWWRRGFLVACNLLLLLAALPAVGRPKAGERASVDKRKAPPISQRAERPPHRRPEKVTSHHTSSSKSSSASSASSSSDDDDDDSGAEVAGEVVGACCAGMIGAMGERSASDPSDVHYDEGYVADDEDYVARDGDYDVYQVQKTSTPRASQTSTPATPPTSTPSAPAKRPPPFDVKAARKALQKALDEVDAQCVTEQERFGTHRLTVTFLPSGAASAATIVPAPDSERLDQCARAVVLRARVPRFDGEEMNVARSILGDAPPPTQADGGT